MTMIERSAIAANRNKAVPRILASSALLALALLFSGCNSGSAKITTSQAQPAGPQTYLAPFVAGGTSPVDSVSAYSFDDTAQTFSESTYYLGTADGALQQGIRTYYSGTTAPLARNLLSLGVGYEWNSAGPLTYNPPSTGSWAFELPNQAGGLVQIQGQPVEPIAAATSCPDFKTPQSYLFVTLPAGLQTSGKLRSYSWNPSVETGFGSVQIGGNGSAITFNNIQQFTFPSTAGGAPGAPANSVTSPQTGACSSSYYGNTTVVPANPTVTDPGPNSVSPPVAAVGIGPTGLLVESNAASGETSTAPYYQNLLGAGTGAIGLPEPSSAVDTSSLVGAQYLGFFYGSGRIHGSGANGWSTLVASFGFSTVPSSCAGVATQTSTMIYGGDFTGNNPASTAVQSTGGFGNCDVAIDLGTQDPNTNGLYPAATVYVGYAFAGNGEGSGYNFPAVAIAGQLGGKYAIFLLGVDTVGSPNQGWGIYLLQSN